MANPSANDSASSRTMLHMVAKLHYVSDMSQVDIARKLGVSTATISRLLQRARAEGIVRIEIPDLAEPEELGQQLIERLGLKQAAVIQTSAGGSLGALAGPLGQMLSEAGLVPGGVLAIGWGRAIKEVIQVGFPKLPGIETVALTGGMQQHAAHFQINEFIRLAAEQTGGAPHFIHAPYLPSLEFRDAFLSDPALRDSVALWDRIDVAVVGIGLPHAINPPEASAATQSEKALVDTAGDVIRHYFDIQGNLVIWDGEERMIAATVQQLRKIPLVIGVAATPEKAPGIIGALRAGLINALVTDTKTAEAVLDAL